ncbi:TadE/TadG family type IV pilus assembly protein [Arthrobacter sp. U41]|uniref:TadE/TadG family type IV pilus assembly protein n=1 Tax=Arthrobacter sp. U41 TaxID=1849032 RepID=UPI0011AA357B|nr:TadE/TadG family type IV pilus assembly protein [Arthrobacter sp. U41]
MKRSKSRAPRAGVEGRERGAAAVEFGLVAPILLLLVGGIVEFSHLYNLQISVTQAAREAARTMAVEHDQGAAIAAGVAGAPGLDAASFGFNFTGVCGGAPGNAAVTVTYTADALTGLFGASLNLEGEGAMRCGG